MRKVKSKPRKIKHKIRTEYLGDVYGTEYPKLVAQTVKTVKSIRRKHPFDAIAFRGSSGAALAFPLSYLMKLPLIHVRKDPSSSHYRLGPIEGSVSSKRYLILDDFIETGSTLKRIEKIIRLELKTCAQPVAVCLYNDTVLEDYHIQLGKQQVPVYSVP